MRHYLFAAVDVGKVGVGVVVPPVRRLGAAVPPIAPETLLVELAFHAVHGVVPLNVEAGVGAVGARPTGGGPSRTAVLLGGLGGLDDVKEDGLEVPLVLALLVDHTLLLGVDLQLDTIDLPLCVLAVHLVVHAEEGDDGEDVGEDEEETLTQLKEARVVLRQPLELSVVDRDGHIENGPEQVARAEQNHEDLQPSLLVFHRAGPLYVHNSVLLTQIVHDAHEEKYGQVQEHRIDQEVDSHLEKDHLEAEEAEGGQTWLRRLLF